MKKERKILIILFMLLMPIVVCGQTKLYKQYQHRKDITVACAMAFPITDSVKVDVTILAPKTKEAVYTLVEEFNLGIEKDIIDEGLGDKNNMGLFSRNVYKNDPTKKYGAIGGNDDYKNISVLAYNYNIGTIVIFHDIDTKERDRAIGRFLTGTLTEPEKFPTIDNANNKK
jgi:hypothetical protein